VFYSINPATHEFFAGRFTLANVQSRVELVTLSFAKIADHPFLGYGSGVKPKLVPTGPVVTGTQLYVPSTYIQQTPTLDSHNAYLQQALYFGLPLGLAVSLALWATAGFFLAHRRATALGGVIAYTLLVQLVSFFFEASYEGTVLRVLFYLSIGLAVALLRSTEAEPPAAREALP
jgi:O-antigen ligase